MMDYQDTVPYDADAVHAKITRLPEVVDLSNDKDCKDLPDGQVCETADLVAEAVVTQEVGQPAEVAPTVLCDGAAVASEGHVAEEDASCHAGQPEVAPTVLCDAAAAVAVEGHVASEEDASCSAGQPEVAPTLPCDGAAVAVEGPVASEEDASLEKQSADSPAATTEDVDGPAFPRPFKKRVPNPVYARLKSYLHEAGMGCWDMLACICVASIHLHNYSDL